MKEITEKEALSKLTFLCSQAEHCSGEMLEKMRKWELDDKAQARIMEYLIKGKYIDDERFCGFFIKDKIKYNKWGRRKIEQALYQKRIEKDVYTPILDSVDDEEYIKILRPIIKNKRKSICAKSEYEQNMKLIKYAMGRGFAFKIIRQCIDGAEEVDDEQLY